MSKLEKLIQELCPDGVEYVKLGKVATVSTGNSAPQKSSDFINGIYPFCRTADVGKVHSSLNFKTISDKLNKNGIKGLRLFPKETILFPKSGASTLLNHRVMLGIDAYVSSHLATIYRNENMIMANFLFYILSQIDAKTLVNDVSYPSLKTSVIKNIKIPLPPLPVQEEIVRILDIFTELTTNLQTELDAELTARKKQYEYYRDKLLTFGDEVEWKTLGEVGTIERGNGLKKSDFKEKGVPCIHYGQLYTHYGTFADKTISFISEELGNKLKKVYKGDLIIAVTSENLEDVCKPLVWLGNEPVATGGHTAIYRHTQNPKYIAYYLQTHMFFKQKRKIAYGTKVTEVTPKKLENIKIPLPSLSEQKRIVSILDKFDALVNDISIGLPAEIEARQKQYEYYREKLLQFTIKN